jgi:hypothetical protein
MSGHKYHEKPDDKSAEGCEEEAEVCEEKIKDFCEESQSLLRFLVTVWPLEVPLDPEDTREAYRELEEKGFVSRTFGMHGKWNVKVTEKGKDAWEAEQALRVLGGTEDLNTEEPE